MRVVSVWAFLLGAIFISGFFLLLPSYILVNIQLDTLSTKEPSSDDTEMRFQIAEQEIIEANAISKQLSKKELATNMSDIITAITGATKPGIELKRFEVTRGVNVFEPILVQGSAETREILLGFKTELERSPLFESATIPIADLITDTNLPFVVTLKVSSTRN